jgi:hypothetical protein
MFGFVLASIFVFGAVGAASAAFGTLLYIGAALLLVMKWTASGFHLPRIWKFGFAGAVGIFFVIGIIVGAVRLGVDDNYTAGLVWISAAWFAVVVSLLMAGLSKMR